MADFEISTIHPVLGDGIIPKRDNNFSLTRTTCCYLLRNQQNDKVVKLNDSSVLVWQLCTGEWTVGDLIAALSEQFPEQSAGIAKDIYRTLDEMEQQQVLELIDQAA